jgi:NAD(P)-dependent dehydrogenase (short-subunit alcohol dehydrogenase family)
MKGKIAVITGGGGAICASFATALAERGARVAVLDRDIESAERVAGSIQEKGGVAVAVECDVTDADSVEKAGAEVKNRLGSCSILVNGAGINHPKASTGEEHYHPGEENDPAAQTFFTIDPGSVRKVFDVNFMGTFLCCQAFAREMLNGSGGVIVNISSMNAQRPMTKVPAYAGSKAAVANFTKWLAVYFGRTNIRVNAIEPGFYLTQVNRDMYIDADGATTPRYEKVVRQTPMARFGAPPELVGTLLYLCDETQSGFVTGAIIQVDGGFSAYSGV